MSGVTPSNAGARTIATAANTNPVYLTNFQKAKRWIAEELKAEQNSSLQNQNIIATTIWNFFRDHKHWSTFYDGKEIQVFQKDDKKGLKLPKNIFENEGFENHIKFLLAGAFRLSKASGDFEAFYKVLQPRIEAETRNLSQAAAEDFALEAMGVDTGNVGVELAQVPKGADDTEIVGNGVKTDPDIPLLPDTGESVAIDLRNKVFNEKLGIGTSLTRNLLKQYEASGSSTHELWRAFINDVRSNQNKPETLAKILTTVVNVMAWLKSGQNNSLSQEQLKSITSDTSKELILNLREVIISANPGSTHEQEAVRTALVQAINEINTDDLFDYIQNNFGLPNLANEVFGIVLSTRKSTDSGSASMQALQAAGGIANGVKALGTSGSHTQTLRIGGVSKGASILNSDIQLEINPDFQELSNAGEYKSTRAIADLIATTVGADTKSDNPLESKLPEALVKDFNNALTRDGEKRQKPTPDYLIPFEGLNEIAEYLKSLANALNSCEPLIKLCKNQELSPAQFAIPFILVNYFKTNTTAQVDFLNALESLGTTIPTFTGMRSTVEELPKVLARKEAQIAEDQIRKEIEAINISRSKSRIDLVSQAETNKLFDLGPALTILGKPVNPQASQINAEGFLMRLMSRNFADQNILKLLGFDADEAINEIYYLVTGNVVLSSIRDKALKVFNSRENQLKTIDRGEFLTTFRKALVNTRAAFHSDRFKDSVLAISTQLKPKVTMVKAGEKSPEEMARAIHERCFKFLEEVENLPVTRTGWSTGNFGNVITGMRKQVENSNLLPFIQDFAVMPSAGKALANKVIEHNAIIPTLANIWRAVASSVKDGSTVRQIEEELRRLAS